MGAGYTQSGAVRQPVRPLFVASSSWRARGAYKGRQPVLQAAAVPASGSLFRIQSLGAVPMPDDPVFAVAPSAYEARALIAQIFQTEPSRVRPVLCPEGERPPRNALIYRLEAGHRPLGDRWVLYRG